MKSFLRKIYLYKFFDDFILIYPFYAVMFADFGASAIQIAILFIVWSSVALILEIPSGVLADKYSRKNILLIGQLIRAFGYAIWIFFPTFFGFLVGFVLWGIKSALSSGTFESLLYDELKVFDRENEFVRIQGKTKALSLFAILLASGGASFGILLGYPFVITMSILAVLVSGVMVFLLPKAPPFESTHEKEYFHLLKQGLSYALQKPLVRRLVILASLIPALTAVDEFLPILGEISGLPNYGIAIFLGIVSGFEGLGHYIAHKFESVSRRILYALFFLSGFLLLANALLLNIPALILASLYMFVFAILGTIFEGDLHHSVPSNNRATISSVSGLFSETGAIGLFFGFGLLAQIYSYGLGFVFLGGLTVVIGFLYLIVPSNKSAYAKL